VEHGAHFLILYYPRQAKRDLNAIDLHDLSAGAALAATTLWLDEVSAAAEQLPVAAQPTVLTVVTGEGSHSRVAGESEVRNPTETPAGLQGAC
jgi:hypothetical protein